MTESINYDRIREGLLAMSSEDLYTLGSIGTRASQVMGWPYLSRRQFDLQGYIVLFTFWAVRIDLVALLDSSDEDFLHDISGILSDIVFMTTGQGLLSFIPKCAKRNQEVPS